MNHKRHELERWVSRKPRREYLSPPAVLYCGASANSAARPARRLQAALWRGDGDGDALNFVFFKIILDLVWVLEGDIVAGVDGGLASSIIENS